VYNALQKERSARRRIASIPLQNFIKTEWSYLFVEFSEELRRHHFDIQKPGGEARSFRVRSVEQVTEQFQVWKECLAQPSAHRVPVPQRILVDRTDIEEEAKDIETVLVSMFALSSSAFGQTSRAARPGGGTKVVYRGVLHECRLTEVKWSHGEQTTSHTLFLDDLGRPVIAEVSQVQKFLHTPWVKVIAIGRPTAFSRPGIDMGVANLVKQAFSSWQANPAYNPLLKMLQSHPAGRPPRPKVKKEKPPKPTPPGPTPMRF
jgi:hypothetical protein